MKGTEAWRTAWRATGTRQAVALVRIACADGFTLNIGTGVMPPTDDGTYWDPVLLDGSISARGAFMAGDISMATATFRASDTALALDGGTRLSTLLWQHDFRGADVTIWLHERSLVFSVDALQRFVGKVQNHRKKLGVVTFNCMQSRDYNRRVEPRVATRAEFPGLLEDATGANLGVIVGNVQGAPLRFKNPQLPYSLLHRFREKIAGGGRAAAALLVDSGRGGGVGNPPARVILAGHRLAQLGAAGPEYGTALFMEGADGHLHVMEPAAGDVFNTDTLAGWNVPDDAGTAWQPIYPASVKVVANSADNPRAILDRFNETSFARLSWALAQTNLTATFASLPEPGTMRKVHGYLIYRSSGVLTGATLIIRRGAATIITTIPASVTEAAVFVDLNGEAGWNTGVLPTVPWDFSQVTMEVRFLGTPGSTGTVDVINMGLTAEYVPAQDIGKIERQFVMVPVQRGPRAGDDPQRPSPHVTYRQQEVLVNVSELRGKFYANAKGMPDADGSITGTVGGVVQQVGHVVRLLLQRFGGQANFNLTPGDVGSFADAGAAFKTRRGGDMVVGLHIAQGIDVAAAIAWITGAVGARVYLSEFDGTWRIVPWRTAPAITYPIPVSRLDLLDPDEGVAVETTPDSDVASGVVMAYGWDAFTRGYAHATSITGSSSSAGHRYRNLRDGSMDLRLNENNKLDWSVAALGFPVVTAPAASFSATIGGGVTALVHYADPMEAAAAVIAAMQAADPARKYVAGCGAVIWAGINAVLEINDGANKTATAEVGNHASMEAMAAAYTAACNAVSSGWDFQYDRPSRKFKVRNTTGPFTLRRSGPLRGQSGIHAMGFYNGYNPAGAQADLTVGAAYTFAQYEREEDLFYIGSADVTLDIPWRSGTNGQLGTKRCCAELLGYDWSNDDTGGQSSHVAVCPKRDLEALLAAADAQFGQKRPLTLDGRAIYDSDTALECRDRLAAILRQSRGGVTFATEIHADAERGDVLPFDADMNTLEDYGVPGTDGQWAARLFHVLETTVKFGTSFHSELVAVDVTD